MKSTCLLFALKKSREYRVKGYPARIHVLFRPTVHVRVEIMLATTIMFLDFLHLDSYKQVKNRFIQMLRDFIPYQGYERVVTCEVLSVNYQ